MEINEAIQKVKPHLKKKRFEHTLRVMDTAEKLAIKNGESIQKAKLAAIFHDYAKYRSLDEMKRWIIHSDLPKDLLDYHHELWHGPVGALLIEREQGITDKEILGAISNHTTGKAHMNKLEMIIYLADYIEPGRDFPGLREVREAADNNLLRACWMVSRNTINYLLNQGASLYPDSIHAYNDFTRQIKLEGPILDE